MSDKPDMTIELAIEFLQDAARYFENRDTQGEDRAHWANVYNAENCRKIVELLCTKANERKAERRRNPKPAVG